MTQASEVSGRIVFDAWALLLALAAVPIFSTVLPPLADYPNHLARFYLLAQGGNDYYAVRWAPLPNLAGDVIVPALAQAMPLGLAAKVSAAAGGEPQVPRLIGAKPGTRAKGRICKTGIGEVPSVGS